MRGPACTVCSHRERAAIDLAISRGVSARALAKRYELGPDAVHRHSKRHLPPQLRAKLIAGPDCAIDIDRLRDNEGQSLLANLVALRHRLFAALDSAEENGDSFMVARVTAQLHKNLELTGSLLGDLGAGRTIVNQITILPAYLEMRIALVNALSPFPDARQAVAAVLHAIESKAAADVTAAAALPIHSGAPA